MLNPQLADRPLQLVLQSPPKRTINAKLAACFVTNPSQFLIVSPLLRPLTLYSDEEEMSSEVSDSDRGKKRFRTAPATPSRQMSIAGQITKPRVSPRGLAKKDYKAIENPFADGDTLDENGNQIFEESALEDEEDDSADDYEKGNGTASVTNKPVEVKMEVEQDKV